MRLADTARGAVDTMVNKLVEYVEIYRKTETLDGFGAVSVTETKVGAFFAWIRGIAAAETIYADKPDAEVSYKLVFRKGVDVRAKDVLVWAGRRLEVLPAVDEFGNNRFLTIIARETIAGA